MLRFEAILQQFASNGEKTGWTYIEISADRAKKLKPENKGAKVKVQMELDLFKKPLSIDLMECLKDEPKALKNFKALPPSHQKYFSNWIESAKTDSTKTKRITQSVIALAQGLGYGEMIRMNRK